MACLPEDEKKDTLWEHYVNKTGMSQEEFFNSSSFFYNSGDVAQCEKFAKLYFEKIEEIKSLYHRDYAAHFFHALSPSFLGNPEHLKEFESIYERACVSNEDSQFIKLLDNEIAKLKEIIKIKY